MRSRVFINIRAAGSMWVHTDVVQSPDVVLEIGKKRSFACALWFPGWFGYGSTPEAAIEQLVAYQSRYAAICPEVAEWDAERGQLEIVESLAGNSTTDFGAPGVIAAAEWNVAPEMLTQLRARRDACRDAFEATIAVAEEELRKGPRGGGRSTSKVVEHVIDAEKAYESRFLKGKWPEAYYLRRSGYHYNHHIWEIEDRSPK